MQLHTPVMGFILVGTGIVRLKPEGCDVEFLFRDLLNEDWFQVVLRGRL